MLLGVPPQVKAFLGPVVRYAGKPIKRALPIMVLALLLAPHRRCLKTLSGMVLGQREHVATISRRLRNRKWRTHDWYTELHDDLRRDTDRAERRWANGAPRRWMIIIDTTYHGTLSECMENLIHMSPRQDPNRRATRQHAFVMGMILTDKGGRIPLPRKSYYTHEYCRKHRKRHRTQVQLAADMIREANVPTDVDVTVAFDSAFDARVVHRACRERGFRAVFPLDPNRNLAADADSGAEPGAKVVHWTRTWQRDEFETLSLQVENEDHVFFRRRHADNLRKKKTQRRYAVAARRAAVAHLGTCLIVASYKENPGIALEPGQDADWWACHQAPVPYHGHRRPTPQRWRAKVLACTDPDATARQVVEWYEVRWQIEVFFRELKSRLQLRGYVLMKFAAVERYLDLLLMGFLVLERERLHAMREAEPPARPSPRRSEAQVQARTTDRLRYLEGLTQDWNAQILVRTMRSRRGQRRMLKALAEAQGKVA